MGQEVGTQTDNVFKPTPQDISEPDLTQENLNQENTTEDNINQNNIGNTLDTAPISDTTNETSNVITIESDDLWQRIKNGYTMPNSKSSLVSRHEDYYTSNPDYVRRMVERSQKYLFHIVEEVEKRGMPTEIALLPMIESAYNPQAYSSGRASGIWQFIPSTGKHFGLKQNWWVDNRRNITIATDAALDYLQKLHGMFGSWDLALAAYNAGEGTVGRAIESNRKLGLATNYESLNLSVETKNYVPKLQAIKNLMTNPGKYGLKIQTIANTAYFTKVSAPAQIDARLAAKLAEISDAEFLALNPSYNRPVIASSGEKHELLLPIASAQTFRDNLAAYNKPLVTWQTYQAKRGERMDKVASKFGIQVDQLRNANNLPAKEKFAKSSTILVPNDKQADTNPAKTTDSATPSPGETNQTDVDVITQQNSANIDIAHTEKLAMTAADENADSDTENNNKAKKIEPAKETNVTHKVKKGDTLQSVAKHYDVSVKQILAANTLKSTQVKVGQILKIKVIESEISSEKLGNSHENKSQEKSKNNKATKTAATKSKTKVKSATQVSQKKLKGEPNRTASKNKQEKTSTSKTKPKISKQKKHYIKQKNVL